jgi:energy-coupling factor transporter ATP-binding protein EcfA2
MKTKYTDIILKTPVQTLIKNTGFVGEDAKLLEKYIQDAHYENNAHLTYVKASEVKAKPINWLWKDRIAKGKITIFAGEGGIGKSTLLIYISSLVSRGGTFPVDKTVFQEGSVVILSAEDDEADTLVPRLKASNANLERIFFLRGTKEYDSLGNEYLSSVSLDKDIDKIDKAIARIGDVSLLIIDPISAYLGEINDHNNSEVRSMLSRLNTIVEKHNCALIINTHLSKGNGSVKANASNRVIGSVAYVNASRATYLISRDPNDPKYRRLFVPVKNNIADDCTGFAYKINVCDIGDDLKSTCIEFFDEIVDDTANEIMEDNAAENKAAKQEAVEFLEEFLKNGSKTYGEVNKAAKERMIALITLKRAKDELKVVVEPSPTDRRKTIWYLPNV